MAFPDVISRYLTRRPGKPAILRHVVASEVSLTYAPDEVNSHCTYFSAAEPGGYRGGIAV